MNRKTLSVCLVAVMVLLPQLAFAQSVVIEDEPDDDVITYTRRETFPAGSDGSPAAAPAAPFPNFTGLTSTSTR